MIGKNALIAMEKLEKAGYEAYAVGGCVRDKLLGIAPEDWDIATSALPEETVNCFSGCKMHTNGLKHGTVGVIICGAMTEITTYRIDGEYSDRRHPESVEFTPSLIKDLARRDFTVNAMAMDKNENIVDPFNGREDLEKKIIRCVDDPDKRFSEDALRIMRGLRFASAEGFTLEENTLKSANKLAGNLKGIAVERIFSELKKMFLKPNAAVIMEKTLPVFENIIPTLNVTQEEWNQVCKRVSNTESLEIRLYCTLEHSCINMELTRLKAESTIKKKINALLELKDVPLKRSRVYLQKLMCAYGRENVLLLCELKQTEGRDEVLDGLALRAASGCTSVKELDISGEEVRKAGFYKYKIKDTLQRLLIAVVEGKCKNENAALCEYLKKIRMRSFRQ